VTRLWTGIALATAAVALSGCGGKASAAKPEAKTPKPACSAAARAGWQKLANRIHAAVFCPSWLPYPLTGVIGSRDNNIDSVDKDRSYLMSWVWQETGLGAGGGELHVNLRAYPGVTKIPSCRNADTGGQIPCFADARGTKRFGSIVATLYTVSQDADQWHIAYVWRYRGNLYTLSEHLAPPLNYAHVLRYLNREMRSLELINPTR
jgi:hypothetical protein